MPNVGFFAAGRNIDKILAVLLLDASDAASVEENDTGGVTRWSDSSGRGNHVYSTKSVLPTVDTNASLQSVLNFSAGLNSSMTFRRPSLFKNLTGITLFLVVQIDNSTTNGHILYSVGTTYGSHLKHSDGFTYENIGCASGSRLTNTTVFKRGVWFDYALRGDNGNGLKIYGNSTTNPLFSTTFSLVPFARSWVLASITGNVAEVRVYSFRQDDLAFASKMSALRTKWSI
jgi:hypothetical protein